jgi:hypothetical protein
MGEVLQPHPCKDSISPITEHFVDTLCTGLTNSQTRGSETQLDQVGAPKHQL